MQSEAERQREMLWVESVRRYNARQSEDLRLQWCEHFRKMRGLHTALADDYDARLRELENGARKETA